MNLRKALLTVALFGVAVLGTSGCEAARGGESAAPPADGTQSPPSGAVTVLIEIHAKEGQEQQARDGLLHAIKTSEKPGFLSSREYEDLDDPGAFYAVQEWENMAAFRQHMTDAAAGDMDEATSMLSEPPRTVVLRIIS